MKIAAVCVTYLRPRQLGWMIHCFLRQDYPADQRELVVLDDAGQYENQSGPSWRLVSTPSRFRTLGEKRNAAAALVGDDVEALAVWDDDDLYLPWALSAAAAALRQAPWSRPSLVLHPQDDGQLRQHATGGLFHGGWAYRRDLFQRAGGYPAMDNGEDQALAGRFRRLAAASADPCALGLPAGLRLLLGRRQLASVGHGRRRLSAAGRPAGGEDAAANRAPAAARPGPPGDPPGRPPASVLKQIAGRPMWKIVKFFKKISDRRERANVSRTAARIGGRSGDSA